MKIDILIIISAAIVVFTGAFLRFFKYFFTPETTQKLTFLLVPEVILLLILVTIKFWRR
jgi:hypothetical protein